jgi:cholest-4-en-3-one 26-monooxygenase
MAQSTCPFGAGFDFTNPDVLLKGIPVTEFAELRKTAPVWWNEQPESIFGDGGYTSASAPTWHAWRSS